MKIFLVFLVIDAPQNYAYHYGLGYISAVLRRDGHDVRSLSIETPADLENFYALARQEKPRIIGFSATSSQFPHLKEIIRRMPDEVDAFLVAGGIHATLNPDCLTEIPKLSAIVRGEGEYAMAELARALDSGQDPRGILNFWFQTPEGVLKNDMRPIIRDLDELPFPDKDPVGYQQVLDKAQGVDRFVFSRGCPFQCTYCSNKALAELYGKGFLRRRSPQKAIEEIRRDAERFEFQRVTFDDDMVTLDKKWFYEFFDLYAREFTFPFDCNIRPGYVDEKMVLCLKRAGAAFVNIGVEHGSEKFRRDVLKRNMTNTQIVETFQMFRKYGIVPYAHVMVGLPYENRHLFWDTVALFRKLGIRWNYISIFSPYPGTELWHLCHENHWMPDRTGYREREEAVVSYPGFSKEEIQQCHDLFPILLRWPVIPRCLESSQSLWAPLALGASRFSKRVRSRLRPARAKAPERCGV